MPTIDSNLVNIAGVVMVEQGVDPAAPVATKHKLFFKSGGLYAIDSTGTVVGPFGTGGGSDDPTGWLAAGETWTYSSADAPAFIFTVSGDKTTKYSAGMRIKLTQTTVKYFIITSVVFSTPNTIITVYGGTDYTLANAAITLPYYSTHKAPQGFPLSPTVWTIVSTDSNLRTESSPSSTWHTISGIPTIILPVGSWKVSYKIFLAGYKNIAYNVKVTLSSANNDESNPEFTAAFMQFSMDIKLGTTLYVQNDLLMSGKTTHYICFGSDAGFMTGFEID